MSYWQPLDLEATCASIPNNNLTACSPFGMVYLNLVTQLYGAVPEAKEPEKEPSSNEEFDFIVVGAGTAGCIVASRLSENPDWSVLLLEAGSYQPEITRVPGLMFPMAGSNVDWQFETEKSETSCLAGGGVCAWVRGKMMGGTSSLNGLVYVRGNQLDYDDWARLGNKGWSFEEILPYFKKSERNLNPFYVDYGYHGFHGKQPIALFNYYDDPSHFILDTFQDLGLKRLDFNGYSQDGTNFAQGFTKIGLRYSSYNSYIEPVKDQRKNLVIRSEAEVSKVLIDGKKRAVGVQYLKDKTMHTANARNEVILSAGAVKSPQILMLSGVGPKEHLKECGIPVIEDLCVGYNIQDHVTCNSLIIALGNKTATTMSKESILQTLKEFKEMDIPKDGPLSNNVPVTTVSFVRLREDAPAPEIQYQFRGIFDWIEYIEDPVNYNRVAVALPTFSYNAIISRPSVLSIKSKGRLRLNTSDLQGDPIINPNYFGDKEDYETLFLGLKYLLQMENTETFKRSGVKFVKVSLPDCKQFEWGTDEYLGCLIRQYTASVNHPAGSCKMGPSDDPTSVVDERLRVYGLTSLRVIDASIMPDVTRGNTNAPCIMIGEKGADMVIQDWSKKLFF